MTNAKYVLSGIWRFPPTPNLRQENFKAYWSLHRYIRKHLAFPSDGLCQSCHERSAKELSNKDGQYSGWLVTWEWSCHLCNVRQPNTRANKSSAMRRSEKVQAVLKRLHEWRTVLGDCARLMFTLAKMERLKTTGKMATTFHSMCLRPNLIRFRNGVALNCFGRYRMLKSRLLQHSVGA